MVIREMSFLKKNVAFITKKNGVYEIKCGLKKKWTTIGFQEKNLG